MHVFKEIKLLRAFLKDKWNVVSIGMVPTMGALHAGHLSLIKASKAENELTLCSIFVNPAQFNNPKDLEKYPRTIEHDLREQLRRTLQSVIGEASQQPEPETPFD